MKQKILFTIIITCLVIAVQAQKKAQRTTAYAITGTEKGHNNWTEVRLVDITSGEEVQSIYKNTQEPTILNARTGKPVVKKDLSKQQNDHVIISKELLEKDLLPTKRPLVLTDATRQKIAKDVQHSIQLEKRVYAISYSRASTDKPFSTYSAACAYDKKHERLYYTPMGIDQLRYIDLKTGNIYYFEDEPFGALQGRGDVANQITRMVIASDGNGYALTNNGDHLIRFTTKKNPVITDLGPLSDNEATNSVSVHSRAGYGGDMVADKSGNLYLLTANRNVFKIDIDKRMASYVGAIKGLPAGFTTNGAIVESGTNIIVTSSTSTTGYFKFDLKDLQAKKVSEAGTVFNASDLANANLLSSDKKKKDKEVVEEQPAEVIEEALVQQKEKVVPEDLVKPNKISVYPNPVTTGTVNVLFNDYPAGRYEVQFMEVSGKVLSSQYVQVNGKSQSKEFKLPSLIAKGNYLVKVVNDSNKVVNVEQLVVQ